VNRTLPSPLRNVLLLTLVALLAVGLGAVITLSRSFEA